MGPVIDVQRRAQERQTRRFETECASLRPLGEAFVMRRFGGELNRADAEDAVSDVLIRFHRLYADGRKPDNVRAAFFTSVRNAAIDILRARAVRPTVDLEAAYDAPATDSTPAELAEGHENLAQLQEALDRMRRNYKEAVLLRFGVGLTVPEIAERQGISLTAAKKLMLRATKQVKQRFSEVTSAEHCEQMQQQTRATLIEKEIAGVSTSEETQLLERHLDHCGHCKAFLVELRHTLHDYGTGLLVASGAATHPGAPHIADHLPAFVGRAGETIHAGVDKARLGAFKAANAFTGSETSGSAGALVGAPQKVIAICGAGAATAATCLATGVVGPGVGQGVEPPAHTRPAAVAPATTTTAATGPTATTTAPTADPATPTPQAQAASEFGFEKSKAAKSTGTEFGAPATGGGSSASTSSSSSGGGSSGGFGFEK
jgi:RNA polymerase sigma factor (sigma-70 family)